MPYFGLKDLLDILLVALLMFGGFRLLRKSGALNLFWGIMAFVFAWFIVSGVLRLEMTGAIFDRVVSVGAFALIVLFQEEIRAVAYKLGSKMNVRGLRARILSKQQHQEDRYVSDLALACSNMQKSKTGALIVIEGSVPLADFASTGEPLDAQVSARLIENIFFKNTPLHDGALIISKGRMVAAACILPVSKDPTIPQHYGLRHRAALGVAEKTDAFTIVVSEETGKISVAEDGSIREVSANALTGLIAAFVQQ